MLLKIFYLSNPASGNKNGSLLYPKILEAFRRRGAEVDSVQTGYAGHGTEIIKNLDFGKYDAIAVSGGDGTLFEAVNGYFTNTSSPRIPMGIIPVGRGNAFARDLDLYPEKWKEAVDAVLAGKRKKIDVRLFRAGSQIYYFVNILGFGFVTDVAATAFKLRAFRDLSYILGVFYRMAGLKPYNLRMEVDVQTIERKNVFAEISNTRYTGKDFLMAPTAEIDDGLLDLTLLNEVGRIRLLQCLPKIFNGSHVTMKEVETFKVKKLAVETVPAKMLTPDGQLMGSTPIEVECLPRAMEVFIK